MNLLRRYVRHVRKKAAVPTDVGRRLIDMQGQCLPWMTLWILPLPIGWAFGLQRATTFWIELPFIGTSLAGLLLVCWIFVASDLSGRGRR
ncbi:MAG TPA: hypothetical protein VGC56_14935 [Allosphingosinicella sp.]|jgi:hypothetical protein